MEIGHKVVRIGLRIELGCSAGVWRGLRNGCPGLVIA